jgi:hypothetical protein
LKRFQYVVIIHKSNMCNFPSYFYTAASIRSAPSRTFHITINTDGDDDDANDDSNSLEYLRNSTKNSVRTAIPDSHSSPERDQQVMCCFRASP